jgi:hypothetical protein
MTSTIEGNNSVGSLLKPTFPHSGFKNVMCPNQQQPHLKECEVFSATLPMSLVGERLFYLNYQLLPIHGNLPHVVPVSY